MHTKILHFTCFSKADFKNPATMLFSKVKSDCQIISCGLAVIRGNTYLLLILNLYIPVNKFSVISGRVFLG